MWFLHFHREDDPTVGIDRPMAPEGLSVLLTTAYAEGEGVKMAWKRCFC